MKIIKYKEYTVDFPYIEPKNKQNSLAMMFRTVAAFTKS